MCLYWCTLKAQRSRSAGRESKPGCAQVSYLQLLFSSGLPHMICSHRCLAAVAEICPCLYLAKEGQDWGEVLGSCQFPPANHSLCNVRYCMFVCKRLCRVRLCAHTCVRVYVCVVCVLCVCCVLCVVCVVCVLCVCVCVCTWWVSSSAKIIYMDELIT